MSFQATVFSICGIAAPHLPCGVGGDVSMLMRRVLRARTTIAAKTKSRVTGLKHITHSVTMQRGVHVFHTCLSRRAQANMLAWFALRPNRRYHHQYAHIHVLRGVADDDDKTDD